MVFSSFFSFGYKPRDADTLVSIHRGQTGVSFAICEPTDRWPLFHATSITSYTTPTSSIKEWIGTRSHRNKVLRSDTESSGEKKVEEDERQKGKSKSKRRECEGKSGVDKMAVGKPWRFRIETIGSRREKSGQDTNTHAAYVRTQQGWKGLEAP